MLLEVYRNLERRQIRVGLQALTPERLANFLLLKGGCLHFVLQVVLANPRLQVAEKLVLAKYIEMIGEEWVFFSVNEAVSACHFSLQESRTIAP